MNIVKYKWIIFSLHEILCFGLISVDLMTSESMTVSFIMSNSPSRNKLSVFFKIVINAPVTEIKQHKKANSKA